jgi:hypothetical protein
MAFIHTNNLTGNDTTGEGTTSLPYKSVYKAIRVAASGDTIKVAGGQWSSALSGDFTFTFNSNTVTTSVSQVGTVLVDDILSFDDGQFGFDKFHLKVTAVAAGSITLATFWPGPTITTSTVKRIETYHYTQSGATPTTFETWSTTDIQPGGRTGITISGGWSTDFTTQNGWTVMRRTGQAITSSNQAPAGFTFSATGGIGAWGQDLIWDRFMAHTTNCLWNFGSATGNSFAMDELAIVRSVLVGLGSVPSGFGLWQADSNTPAKLYATSPGVNTSMTFANGNYASNTDQPDVFEIDVYGTLSWTTVNTGSSQAAGFGMATTSYDGSKNQMNLHVRQNIWDWASGSGTYAGYPASSIFAGGANGLYVKNLYYYQNAPGILYFAMGNQTAQIENIELLGTYASKTSMYLSSRSGQFVVDLFDEAKTIDQFNPGTGSLGTVNGTYNTLALNQLCQTNLNVVQVKDVEGLKTLDFYNNIYFKTPSGLKVSSATSFSSNSSLFYVWKMIGVTSKPTTPFTVSFTLKVDAGKEAEWDTIAVQYGPNTNQIVTQALTPTSSFATYTMTIDPASYADWNKFKFPIYFGIRSKTANTYNDETMSYAYIQSVTIA